MTTSDLTLLAIQAEGTLDPTGHMAGQYGITIACAPGDHVLWIGSKVPAPIADELAEAFAATVAERDPAARPAAMDRCRQILEVARGVEEHAGPSFVFPDVVRSMSDIRVLRCDDRLPEALRGANPGNWLAGEWDELLDGRLGPWAMVREGDRVVSIGNRCTEYVLVRQRS